MKMKGILNLFLVIVLAVTMTACSSPNNKETASDNQAEQSTAESEPAASAAEPTAEATAAIEPVTIEFWHAMSGIHQDTLVALTDKFNAENGKGITVNLVNQGAYGDLSKKLMGSVAAKTLPDLAQVYNSWIVNYLDAVVPLDNYVASDFDNYDDIVESYRNESSEFGKIYTLPFNKSTQLYFYNKTVFNELGLEPPKTWEDLYHIGEVVYNATGKPAIGYDDLTAMFQQFVLQNGSEFIQDGQVKFNNPQGIEAFDYFLDMYKKGYARIAGEDQYHSGPFGNGDVLAYVGSSAGVAFIQANGFEFGVAPLPAGKKGAVPQAGTDLAMFTQDKNRQLAAWEYMKYLTSADATTQWAMATGYLPVRVSAFNSETFQNYMKDNEAAKAAYEQVADQYFEPAFKGSDEIRSMIGTEVESAILEGRTAEEAVSTMASKAEEILKK